MAELVPPDEIYVPWQAAIDFDIYARDGVITKEHRYLLATPKRKAADEMYDLLTYDLLGYFESQWEAVDKHPASHYADYVGIIKAAIAKADGDKDGG